MRIKNNKIKFSQKERYDLKRAIAICEEGIELSLENNLMCPKCEEDNPFTSAIHYLTDLLTMEEV